MKIEDKGQCRSFDEFKNGRLGGRYDFTPENETDQKFLEYLDEAIKSVWRNYHMLSNRQQRKRPHPIVSNSSTRVGGKFSPLTLSVYPENPK